MRRIAGGGMYSGVILAALIGLGVAFVWTRSRRRLGLPVNGKHWIGVVIVVVVLLVIAYGASHTRH